MSDYVVSLIKLKLSTSDKSMKDLVDEIHDGFTQPQVRDGVWHLIDRGEVFIGRDRLLTLQNPYPVDTERDSLCQQLAVMRAALAECATVTTRVSAQLRHAYHNLIDGRVYAAGVRSFADGLIAPQIRALEDLARVADVDHAVRVEAARDAVRSASVTVLLAAMLRRGTPSPAQWKELSDALSVLDALTSERKP